MKLSELIISVGDDNVAVQPLADCMTNIRANNKGISTITFKTDQLKPDDLIFGHSQKVGLVIWIPRNKLPK